jgi:microcystin-dependent protein
MTPGARYYASYDGGISSSSDDGVLLGRALREELLLLERDFAGGFKADSAGAGGSSTYAGEIKALAGSTVPAGWIQCNGQAISRIDFSALFAALGEIWGNGDGSTTFNVPDLRGRTMVGSGNALVGGSSVSSAQKTNSKASNHALGEYDGSEKFTFTAASFKSQNSQRTYCHITESHTGSGQHNGGGWCRKDYSTLNHQWPQWEGVIAGEYVGGSLGGNTNEERINMMPYMAVTYIIKT